MIDPFLYLLGFIISVVFPVYASYKALKENDQGLLRPWLIYWVVFSTLTAAESIFGLVLQFIPFYSFIRLYVLIWLVLPQSKGAVFIYTNYLKPYLEIHEQQIEGGIDDWYILARGYIKGGLEKALSLIKEFIFSIPETSDHTSFLGKSAEPSPNLSNSITDSILSQFKNSDAKTDINTGFLQSILSTFNGFNSSNEASSSSPVIDSKQSQLFEASNLADAAVTAISLASTVSKDLFTKEIVSDDASVEKNLDNLEFDVVKHDEIPSTIKRSGAEINESTNTSSRKQSWREWALGSSKTEKEDQ